MTKYEKLMPFEAIRKISRLIHLEVKEIKVTRNRDFWDVVVCDKS